MKERYDDIDEYIRDLQAEISRNDQCANHYYNLGVALLSKGDFVEAESAFLDAVRNSPHLAEAYSHLGHHRGDLPITEAYSDTVLSLPFHPYMEEGEIALVADAVRGYLKG